MIAVEIKSREGIHCGAVGERSQGFQPLEVRNTEDSGAVGTKGITCLRTYGTLLFSPLVPGHKCPGYVPQSLRDAIIYSSCSRA